MSVPDPFPDGVAAIPVATCGSLGEAIVSARALQDRVAFAGEPLLRSTRIVLGLQSIRRLHLARSEQRNEQHFQPLRSPQISDDSVVQSRIGSHDEENCYEMQIKLLQASLAGPSGRSSVCAGIMSKSLQGTHAVRRRTDRSL